MYTFDQNIVSEGNTLARIFDVSTSSPILTEDSHQALLRSIAEQLKLPLMYIARQAEFYRTEETLEPTVLRDMQVNADMALRLVDSYILGLDLATKQMNLQLEPVSVSSALYDVAHNLEPLVRQRNGELQLVLAGKYGQVMAHKQGLMAALYSVGSVLAEIDGLDDATHSIKIAAHHSPRGIITGVYIDNRLATPSVARGRGWQGTMRQPFADVTASGGAGVFVADAIFASMNTRLRYGRFRSFHGLAATLQPNKQLRLV